MHTGILRFRHLRRMVRTGTIRLPSQGRHLGKACFMNLDWRYGFVESASIDRFAATFSTLGESHCFMNSDWRNGFVKSASIDRFAPTFSTLGESHCFVNLDWRYGFVESTSIGRFALTFSTLGESLLHESGFEKYGLWIQPLSTASLRYSLSALGLPIGSKLDFIQVLSSNGVVCTQAYYASVTYGVWCARAPYAFRPREGIRGKPLFLKFI